MSNSIEKTAKTVQEAIDLAIEELGVSADDVNVDVIDEGNKGLFGILGGKLAKVKVSLEKSTGFINRDTARAEYSKDSIQLKLESFLQDVFDKMNVRVEMEFEEDEDNILVKVKGDDVGILIGRRGETLDSLQYLASLVANRKSQFHKKVVLDVESYRQRREEALIRLANKLASRVIKYRKSITLEPMTPYERRIIHASLQENKLVDTYSVGEEPFRKIVIKLK